MKGKVKYLPFYFVFLPWHFSLLEKHCSNLYEILKIKSLILAIYYELQSNNQYFEEGTRLSFKGPDQYVFILADLHRRLMEHSKMW